MQGICCALLLAGCSRPAPELGSANYQALGLPRTCAPAEKPGAAGVTERLLTAREVAFSVRTPRNYDAQLAHPLLVMFAPAGQHRFAAETFYALTREATDAGFIVAFSDHLRLSLRAFEELGQVPGLIAARWCVDAGRVFLAGHSDGGTTAAAVAFLRKSQATPRAIVLSAAGMRKQDLEAYACPPALSVLVLHSRRDTLFPPPAYGLDAARWWAACNRCTGEPVAGDEAGCVEFRGCAPSGRTRYCEVDTPHRNWPAANSALLDFLARADASPRP